MQAFYQGRTGNDIKWANVAIGKDRKKANGVGHFCYHLS
jgi:hypothetical protein